MRRDLQGVSAAFACYRVPTPTTISHGPWKAPPCSKMAPGEEGPFRETGYQVLMRAHAAAGNRAEALWVYERCRKIISDTLALTLPIGAA
jgi:hypothetical protein